MARQQSHSRLEDTLESPLASWRKRKDRLHEILEAPAAEKRAAKGSTEQIVGHHGACMDESRVNACGMDPVRPWFAKIDASPDMTALQQ
jgi:predicted metalloendopeptidase